MPVFLSATSCKQIWRPKVCKKSLYQKKSFCRLDVRLFFIYSFVVSISIAVNFSIIVHKTTNFLLLILIRGISPQAVSMY